MIASPAIVPRPVRAARSAARAARDAIATRYPSERLRRLCAPADIRAATAFGSASLQSPTNGRSRTSDRAAWDRIEDCTARASSATEVPLGAAEVAENAHHPSGPVESSPPPVVGAPPAREEGAEAPECGACKLGEWLESPMPGGVNRPSRRRSWFAPQMSSSSSRCIHCSARSTDCASCRLRKSSSRLQRSFAEITSNRRVDTGVGMPITAVNGARSMASAPSIPANAVHGTSSVISSGSRSESCLMRSTALPSSDQ